MEKTQKHALKLVLELAEQNIMSFEEAVENGLHREVVRQQAAILTVEKMLGKVQVNPEPEPLVQELKGPLMVQEFLSQISSGWSAQVAIGHEKLKFHRRGSGPHTVTNPVGSFIPGDFVTFNSQTYSITE